MIELSPVFERMKAQKARRGKLRWLIDRAKVSCENEKPLLGAHRLLRQASARMWLVVASSQWMVSCGPLCERANSGRKLTQVNVRRYDDLAAD